MSGGSFNYLCQKYGEDLIASHHEDVEHMISELAATGYAQDAAQETAGLLAEIRAAAVRIDSKLDRLRDVWKAMEWWRSCDWSENDLKRAVAEYRGIELPTCKRCVGTGREPNKDYALACQNPDCARGKDVEQIGGTRG